MVRAGGCMWVVIMVLAASATWAQEKPADATPAPVRANVIGVEERAVPVGDKLPLTDDQYLHQFIGRPGGAFYLMVKVRRELRAKTPSDIVALKIELRFRTTAPVLAHAVAVEKKYLVKDESTYAAQTHTRWVNEVHFFPIMKGQRNWEVLVNGKPAAKAADYYTTLVVHGLDGVTMRIKLPDGNYRVLNGRQQNHIQFPAGDYNLVVEARGHGKIALPWKKYKKAETHYLAVAKDPRNAPIIPVDRLKIGLPKIYAGYKKYRRQTGTGGGHYNIGSQNNPVHVRIDFGKDGTKGPLWKCSADRIEVEFNLIGKKKRRRSKLPPAVKYSETYNRSWEVRPWEKAENVYVQKKADEIIGEVVAGRLHIRSTAKTPSKWTVEGYLEKGYLYDEKLGYFAAEVRKQGELYILEGASAKEPR